MARKFEHIDDWRAAKSFGYDPGERPPDPYRPRGNTKDPVVMPEHTVTSVGGLYGSRLDYERRCGKRARQIDALLTNLGIRPRR